MKTWNLYLISLFVCLGLFSIDLRAQTVVINTGTAGTPEYAVGPVYMSSTLFYRASRYAYLYTASEMSTAGIPTGANITVVGWMKNNSASSLVGGVLKIYMKNSAATAYSNATETWTNLNAGTTLVYQNNNLSIPATANPTYIPFTLTTPFTYTGGSIEISVEWDLTGSTATPATGSFDWMWSTVVDRIYGNGGTTLNNTLSSTSNNTTIDNRRPFIQITYVTGSAPVCPTPTAPTATAITAASASLNWTQTGTPIGWQIKYGAPGFNPATAGTAIYTTTKPYILPGLTSTTTYNYYVRAVCAPSDTSAWSAVHSFTTLCNAPSIASRKDSSRCGPGEVVLGATSSAGGIINWYANATGGAPLATGNTFTTPSLTTTTNYYVSASGGSGGVTSGSIATLTGGTNGCGGGVMFNITPTVDIVVDSFLNLSNAAQTTTVTVYYKNGTYVGSELTAAAWTTLGTVAVNTAAGTMTPINVGASITMTAGNTYGIFIANMSNGYTDGNGPNQVFTNADLTLNAGAGLCGVFTSTVNAPRVFNGTVYYHKGSSCQSPRLPVVATIKTLPEVNLGNDTTICPNVTYTFNAGNPGSSYLWTNGATSQSITTSNAGSFGVQVTAANGCVNTDNITITQGINPVNVLPATTNLCDGSTASLNAGNTGSTFLWTPNGQVTQVINETDGGTYSVAIKSVDGCKITSETNVIIRPLPVDNLGNDTSICDGATIPLDAGNPGYAYQWSNGATTQIINASDSGLYTVTVTTPFNCTNEEDIHISYLPSPRVEGFNFIPQFYENLGQVQFSPLNPVNVNSYLWDFGDGSPTSTAVNPVHTYTSAGNFIVTLKVFNGCGNFDISLPINVDLTTGIVGPGTITAQLSLYPNPAQDMITIENKSSDIKMQELSVFNILGTNVHSSKANSGDKHQFSVAHLAPGLYTVRILTDKGFVVRKFEVLK